MSYHQPVMLRECIEGLAIDPSGIYVDVTFGGGGHSNAILEKLTSGKLVAFDQDADAQEQAKKIHHPGFLFVPANFRYLKKFLKLNGIPMVNGILGDLGISSWQIDSPGRGFSTRFDGPLDMRMNQAGDQSAADVVNNYTEAQLHKVLGIYGEIKNARTLAGLLVQQRGVKKFTRIRELTDVLKAVAPRGKEFKYFAQVFQALRIEVNEEMQALESFLLQCGEVMAKDGRLVVMSYHSLEDRLVKNYMQTGKMSGEVEKDFFGNPIKPFQAVTRKPVEAGEEEIKNNNRARSAKLRIARKL